MSMMISATFDAYNISIPEHGCVEIWDGLRKVTIYSDGHLLCTSGRTGGSTVFVRDVENASISDILLALAWIADEKMGTLS
jgi:hypothetical protein